MNIGFVFEERCFMYGMNCVEEDAPGIIVQEKWSGITISVSLFNSSASKQELIIQPEDL